MTELERALADLPDAASVPVGWVRAKLAESVVRERPRKMVRMQGALEILGDVSDRKLRRWAATWERQQQRGRTPAVCVERVTPGIASHWLFDEEGLYELRRRRAVKVVTDETGNEAEDIAEGIFRRQFGA